MVGANRLLGVLGRPRRNLYGRDAGRPCAPRSSPHIRRGHAASARSPQTCAGALLGVDGIDRVEKVVVVNEPSSPQRPGVVATVAQAVRGDYVRAARLLGRLDVDVVLLQHEYGIFGGRDGEYVLSFAEELAQPLVVTLHTRALGADAASGSRCSTALCRQARARDRDDRHRARSARRGRDLPGDKVRVVPHGAPPVLARRAASSHAQARAAVTSRRCARRLRAACRAVPALHLRADLGRQGHRDGDRGAARDRRAASRGAVPDRRADAPGGRASRRRARTACRSSDAVLDLGLEDHVEFDDRFLAIDELADLLAATDVFVTPYRQQRADRVRRADVRASPPAAPSSRRRTGTPRTCSRSGAGTTRAVRRSGGPRRRGLRLHRRARGARRRARRGAAHRRRAGLAGRRRLRPRTCCARRSSSHRAGAGRSPSLDLQRVEVRTDHLLTLVDDVGIVQHANGVIPNRRAATASTTSRGSPSSRSSSRVAATSRAGRRSCYRVAGVPARRDRRRRRGHAELHGLRPALARRAARRRPRRPLGLGARRDPRRPPGCPRVVGPTERLLDTLVRTVHREAVAAHRRLRSLGLARLDPDRLDLGARSVLERVRRPARSSLPAQRRRRTGAGSRTR